MKKILLLTVLLISSFSLFAQNEALNSEKKLKFGFNIGLHYSNLITDNNTFLTDVVILEGLNFQLGVLADYKFSKYFSISPRTNLSFNQCGFIYFENGAFISYPIMLSQLGISTYLKFQKPKGKVKPYFLLGPTFKTSLSKKPTTINEFGTNNDLAIDFGIGIDNRFKHFNFVPELRYSYGLRSVSKHPSFRLVYLHQVSFVFNFLG